MVGLLKANIPYKLIFQPDGNLPLTTTNAQHSAICIATTFFPLCIAISHTAAVFDRQSVRTNNYSQL